MNELFTKIDGHFRAEGTTGGVTVTGDVRIGADASLWFGVIIRGDVAPIVIGDRVNVQDGTIIHCDTDVPNVIDAEVSIGHRAIVHGKHIGRGTLIGMGAIVMGQTDIGEECIIGAGAVLTPGTIVPSRSVVMGVPGKVVRSVTVKDLEYMRWLTRRYIELARKYVSGEIVMMSDE